MWRPFWSFTTLGENTCWTIPTSSPKRSSQTKQLMPQSCMLGHALAVPRTCSDGSQACEQQAYPRRWSAGHRSSTRPQVTRLEPPAPPPKRDRSCPSFPWCFRFLGVFLPGNLLRLTFPRAKLRRQIFMTRAEVWAKNWAKISAHFRASFAVQNDPQIFSPNSFQFITPCLVAEILKFHLRELLGFGAARIFGCCQRTTARKTPATSMGWGDGEELTKS